MIKRSLLLKGIVIILAVILFHIHSCQETDKEPVIPEATPTPTVTPSFGPTLTPTSTPTAPMGLWIRLYADPPEVPADNLTKSMLTAIVTIDRQPVIDGTIVYFNSTFGTLDPQYGYTQNGVVKSSIRSGSTGTTTVCAMATGTRTCIPVKFSRQTPTPIPPSFTPTNTPSPHSSPTLTETPTYSPSPSPTSTQGKYNVQITINPDPIPSDGSSGSILFYITDVSGTPVSNKPLELELNGPGKLPLGADGRDNYEKLMLNNGYANTTITAPDDHKSSSAILWIVINFDFRTFTFIRYSPP